MTGIGPGASLFLAGCVASCGVLLVVAGISKLYRAARRVPDDSAVRRALGVTRRRWRRAEPAIGLLECAVGAIVCAGVYPALYCAPFSPYHNCTTIAAARGLNIPVSVWSSEPEPCGTLRNRPNFNAQQCSSASHSKVRSHLWQFGEQGGCGYSANVDLDLGDVNIPSYCFRVVARP